MTILSGKNIKKLLNHENVQDRLVVTPILDEAKQIGPSTIDLRLGTRFKVDMRTREPFFDPLNLDRPIDTFYDETYREFGEKFLLYPGQLVNASTFEYVRLPNNLFGLVFTRSSWNRLGLKISSIIQPGYAGVLTLELTNTSSNPLAVYPGLRIVQVAFLEVDDPSDIGYIAQSAAKYVADAEPQISNIASDAELQIIKTRFLKKEF